MEKICNYCEHLRKYFHNNSVSTFKALCNACHNSSGDAKFIDTIFSDIETIERPEWCPKNIEGIRALPQPVVKLKKTYTYSEKRDAIMAFPRFVEWKDIKVGDIYVMPKALYSPLKIVRVESIDSYKAVCKELPNGDSTASTYSTYIYEKDIEAILLVPFHSF